MIAVTALLPLIEDDSTHGTNFKMSAFAFLKVDNNIEKIAGLRATFWTKHTNQAFG